MRHFIPTIAAAELPTMVEHTAVFNLLFSDLPDEQDVVVIGEGADGLFGLKTYVLLSIMDTHPLAMRTLSKPPLLAFLATASRLTGRYGSLVDGIGRSRYRRMPLSSPDHWMWLMGWLPDGSVLQDLWSKVAEANGRTASYPFSG